MPRGEVMKLQGAGKRTGHGGGHGRGHGRGKGKDTDDGNDGGGRGRHGGRSRQRKGMRSGRGSGRDSELNRFEGNTAAAVAAIRRRQSCAAHSVGRGFVSSHRVHGPGIGNFYPEGSHHYRRSYINCEEEDEEDEGEERDELFQQLQHQTSIHFQVYQRGAWWDVDVLQHLGNSMYIIRYKAENPWPISSEDVDRVPMDILRLSPRAVDDWDCAVFRRGVDVSVLTAHPEAELSTPALYDGKVINVERNPHMPDCMCTFTVHLFHIKRQRAGKGKGKRKLEPVLKLEPETERKRDQELAMDLLKRDLMETKPLVLRISELKILQRPCVTPFYELLKATIAHNRSVADSRQSNDALFLQEAYTHGNGGRGASTSRSPPRPMKEGEDEEEDISEREEPRAPRGVRGGREVDRDSGGGGGGGGGIRSETVDGRSRSRGKERPSPTSLHGDPTIPGVGSPAGKYQKVVARMTNADVVDGGKRRKTKTKEEEEEEEEYVDIDAHTDVDMDMDMRKDRSPREDHSVPTSQVRRGDDKMKAAEKMRMHELQTNPNSFDGRTRKSPSRGTSKGGGEGGRRKRKTKGGRGFDATDDDGGSRRSDSSSGASVKEISLSPRQRQRMDVKRREREREREREKARQKRRIEDAAEAGLAAATAIGAGAPKTPSPWSSTIKTPASGSASAEPEQRERPSSNPAFAQKKGGSTHTGGRSVVGGAEEEELTPPAHRRHLRQPDPHRQQEHQQQQQHQHQQDTPGGSRKRGRPKGRKDSCTRRRYGELERYTGAASAPGFEDKAPGSSLQTKNSTLSSDLLPRSPDDKLTRKRPARSIRRWKTNGSAVADKAPGSSLQRKNSKPSSDLPRSSNEKLPRKKSGHKTRWWKTNESAVTDKAPGFSLQPKNTKPSSDLPRSASDKLPRKGSSNSTPYWKKNKSAVAAAPIVRTRRGGIDPTLEDSDVSLPSPRINLTDSSDSSDSSLKGSRRRRLRSLGEPKRLPRKIQNSTENRRDTERQRGSPPPESSAFRRPLYLDLLENNSINDVEDGRKREGACGSEKMPTVAEPEQKAKNDIGIWKPTKPSSSDSESSSYDNGEINPLAAQVIARRKEMAADQRDAASSRGGWYSSDYDSPSDSDHGSEGGESFKCNHVKTILQESIGIICERCGICIEPIEEVVPEVVWYQPRAKEADPDEIDFNTGSPDGQQQMNFYDHDEEVKAASPEKATMLSTSLPPHYARQMHAHQREGYEFLWRNLTEGNGPSIRRRVDKISGCILSHAPGTGKSFLIVAFLMSFMDKFPSIRPLIVVPKIMLMRWEKEFQRWKANIKVIILNSEEHGRRLCAKHEELGLVRFQHPMTVRQTVDVGRLAMLYEWKRERSVLLVSYHLFTHLTDDDGPVSAKRPAERSHDVGRALLTLPGVLILDEGHFPRNQNTRVRKALMRVEAKSRILLSGTLFQNNFEELFNTLYLVRPGFVEAFSSLEMGEGLSDIISAEDIESQAQTQGGGLRGGARCRLAMEEATQAAEKKARKLFVDEIGTKIEEGQLCQGSEILQHGLQKLQRLTTEFVHHHTGEVLNSLPGLRDFGIVIKPTPLQRVLLDALDKEFERSDEYLKREIAVSEAGIHPHLVNMLDFVDPSMMLKYSARGTLSQSEWGIMDQEPNFEDGVKTKFVFDLLRSLEPTDEKLLIFSQHLQPLDMLERMLKYVLKWDMGKHVLRLDGQMPMESRDGVIDKFNSVTSTCRVLLASTRACGEGINLIGASRVIFLDVLWNPAVIKQAMSRAFRLGQQKPVYVYRLITLETMEEKKYKRAIRKDWLSMSIFTPAEPNKEDAAKEGSPHENPDVDLGQTSTGSDLDEDSAAVELQQQPPEAEMKVAVDSSATGAEMLAWEVNADTCEDGILEKLLRDDMSNSQSYVKIVEHGSKFHHRKTACGPDAREYFLADWDYRELSHVQRTEAANELGEESNKTLPENIADDIYDDLAGEPEACKTIHATELGLGNGVSDSDEEI